MAKQIGALWMRTYNKDDREEKFLSGVLDLGALGEINVAIFKNSSKTEEKHPDYRIILSENREREERPKQNKNRNNLEPF